MIQPYLYPAVFLYSVIILTLFSLRKVGNTYEEIEEGQNNTFFYALIVCVVFSLWLGMRPPVSNLFGDTINYAEDYYMMQHGINNFKQGGEWIWNGLMYGCAQIMDVSEFFTLVSIGYFGFTLWCCKRFTSNNVLISLLFFLGSLSFYSYGTNGIRNGLACSMTLVALSYLTTDEKKDKIIAAIIAFIAFNIHHTVGLPILMAVISYFFIKSFKQAYYFWIASILISLVAGGAVTSFFAGLGFDDRLSYLVSTQDSWKFSNMGFRWDFLIYSMMPIVLGYYIVIKRGIEDKTYIFLLNTYTLANAFWVMVIRASYSNRFAYLSWFIYPIVLAYPLLKLDIWGEEQGKYLKYIMLANVGFTWFMQIIYW